MSSFLQYYGRLFEDGMVRFFYNYGLIVGKHPKYFLWGSLLFTLMCTPGLLRLDLNLDLYKLFVPGDAPVKIEFERQQEFNKLPAGDLIIPPDKSVRQRTKRSIDSGQLERWSWDLDNFHFDDSSIGKMPNRLLENLYQSEALELGNNSRHYRARRDVDAAKSKTSAEIKEKKQLAIQETKDSGLKHDILRFYVVHKNFDNLLDTKYLGLLWNYTNEMMLTTAMSGKYQYNLEDFCRKEAKEVKCNNMLNVWLKHADVLFRDGKIRNNPNLQLSYPVMYLFNRPKDIGNVIYGVNVTGEKNEIVGAKVLTMHWFVTFPNSARMTKAYADFRDALNEFWESKQEESGLTFIPHNERAMDDEMLKIIYTVVPYAFPSATCLMLFVIFANWSKKREKNKPIEMWLGVICVCLALIQTFGIFFACGVKFNPVTSTMPFLILAVGVDDDFLMMAAWRELDRKLSIRRRLALVMADAGASITVTSFTNFFCFGLGWILTSTPAVSEFCLVTAVGVIFDYVMQLTFFASIIVISGQNEDRGGLSNCCYRNCRCLACIMDSRPMPPKQSPSTEREGSVDSEEIDPNHHAKADHVPLMHRWFRDTFAPFVLRKDVKIISWSFFIVYVIISMYGCCQLKVDISPVKYIRDNSPIQTFVRLADKYIWADNVMPSFHVMKPPDLRDPAQRAKFNEVVFRLEHTNYSIGRVSTNLWIWQYQNFLNDFPDVDYYKDFYNKKYLSDFFGQLDYSQYRDKVKIMSNVSNGEPCIAAFSFQTSFYGLDSWDKRQAELFNWRNIIAEYPEFDIFLAGIFSPFLIDQRRTIAPSSMQTVGCALLVMSLISFFFLPDAQSVFLMTWSLLSISMGVCGGLAMLGSDLDSVSMGCIVMAIGLAVDYSIHICYRYHRSEMHRADDKVRDTLCSVGWPITQAVTSTLAATICLIFVPAYLIRVFFQTVYLVNICGIFHALVLLPQLISMLDPCERVPFRQRAIKH